MVHSAQIYRYKLCPTKGELRQKLGTGTTFQKTVKNKNMEHFDEELVLTTTISKIYENSFGIGGTITSETQKKLPHGIEEYRVVDLVYHFFIVPQAQILIFYGSPTDRGIMLNRFEEFIVDDRDSGFSIIIILSEKMDELTEKIRIQSIRNYVKITRSKHNRLSDFEKIEDNIIKMHHGNCATKSKKFETARKHASSWDCQMKIFKLNGILDTEVSEEITFNITKTAAFASSEDVEPEKWNRFVIETCKGIVY